MSRFQKKVEFANFILHVGELKFLDVFHQIVYAAFFERWGRKYGNSTYMLHKCSLVNVGRDEFEPAIVGRIIKDERIIRHQRFEEGELIDDPAELANCPSSLFALLLKSHRLMFLREMPGAPGVDAFRTTVENFLKRSWKTFLKEEFDKGSVGLDRASKAELRKRLEDFYPKPELKVIPLVSDNDDIERFLGRYHKIETIGLKIIKPNDENDSSILFREMRRNQAVLGDSSGKVVFQNSAGLDKEGARNVVSSAIEDQNVEFTIVGQDQGGGRLSVQNDDAKYTVPLGVEIVHPIQAARAMFQKFKALLEARIFRPPSIVDLEQVEEKIEQIAEIYPIEGEGDV
ncbi:hypothetical protein [Chitinolyticbacter albus]|uniref:hypothetical protein n=1 Tax=Chitinolyticbacter albus TaxID=2961951 RepID=UPI00210B2528|nr:hypothetical protein [Chitinolyticbacter albus]